MAVELEFSRLQDPVTPGDVVLDFAVSSHVQISHVQISIAGRSATSGLIAFAVALQMSVAGASRDYGQIVAAPVFELSISGVSSGKGHFTMIGSGGMAIDALSATIGTIGLTVVLKAAIVAVGSTKARASLIQHAGVSESVAQGKTRLQMKYDGELFGNTLEFDKGQLELPTHNPEPTIAISPLSL